MHNNQSLKKRYFAKLSTNLIGLAISLVTIAIIPRGLGPKAYGDFNFLSDFFNQLIPFLTFNTSIGFFTKLSQRQNEFGLISFYARIIAIAFLAVSLFITAAQVSGLANIFWVDQNIGYVYMAAVYSALIWLISSLTQISDAYGITISTEIVKIIQKVFGLILILLLFYLKILNLTSFFFYNYFITILLVISLVIIINRYGHSFLQSWKLSREQIKKYLKEFYTYSRPLFVYSVTGVVFGIFDRWILQKFSGSVQQGFFSLALQVGAICFLFTSAMTSLITREFSIAYKQKDLEEMGRLFRRYIPMLYSIAAFFGCFISIQAEKIIYIFGGSQYTNAVIPMMIMAFYPIHQTYGQLSGSVFYASGQTKLYSSIGLIFIILGLPVVYFAIAPGEKLGLNAGATGLAIKFVLLQFIAVNVQLFFNAKLLQLSFGKFFTHQLLSVAVLVIFAFVSRTLVDAAEVFSGNVPLNFILSGILYTGLMLGFTLLFPQILGLYRSDIIHGIETVKRHIKKK